MKAPLTLTLCAAVLGFSGSASAQFGGGYDVGPSFMPYIGELLQQGEFEAGQAHAMQMQFIEANMSNPRVQAQYQNFLAQGGQLAFPDYAYLWGATAAFTPEGIAYFMQTEQDSARREQFSRMGVLAAEQARAAAQGTLFESYEGTTREGGLLLGGTSTYIDTRTGQPVVLSHTQPNVPQYDHITGQTYIMDDHGNYSVQGTNGYWYPMTPRY